MKLNRLACLAFAAIALPLAADSPPPPPLALIGPTATNAPSAASTTTDTKTKATPAAPAGSRLGRPAHDVLTMANGGVPAEVLIAYIQNSINTFNLTPENIIYLKDLGISSSVINAMLSHDKALRDNATQQQQTTPATMPAQPTYPPPGTAPSEPFSTTGPQYDNNVPEQAGYFYNDLAPYGSWYSMPGLGWAWQPAVASTTPDWAPYCNGGQWFQSNFGWYWHSSYPWGWAAFHFGRWCQHPSMGWLWFPGTTWAPSWVNWRSAPGFCGWSPLSPFNDPTFGLGAGVGAASFNNRAGFNKNNNFTFVPMNRFGDANLAAARLNSAQVQAILPKSTPLNNSFAGSGDMVVNRGFNAAAISRVSQNQILRVNVVDQPTGGKAAADQVFSTGGITLGTLNGMTVFRANFQNAQPPLSTAQATAINPLFPQMRNPGALLNTGQPTTAQSQRINPMFPNLRSGTFTPDANNQPFFIAPFPSGDGTVLNQNQNRVFSPRRISNGQVVNTTGGGTIANFAPPGSAAVSQSGPIGASFRPPGSANFTGNPVGGVPFRPPGAANLMGGPVGTSFRPPGAANVSGFGGGAAFRPAGAATGRAVSGARGAGARGGGGGGHR